MLPDTGVQVPGFGLGFGFRNVMIGSEVGI